MNKDILIVDDARLNQCWERVLSYRYNSQVEIVESTESAIRKIDDKNFGLVIIEPYIIGLPNKSYYSISQLFTKVRIKEMPIMVLTSQSECTLAEEYLIIKNHFYRSMINSTKSTMFSACPTQEVPGDYPVTGYLLYDVYTRKPTIARDLFDIIEQEFPHLR